MHIGVLPFPLSILSTPEIASRVTDIEAVAMSRYLVQHDGLFLGSSSACNLVACVKLAKTMEKGSVIVTILCDSGSRHYSKVRHYPFSFGGQTHPGRFLFPLQFWWVGKIFHSFIPETFCSRNDAYLERVGISHDCSLIQQLLN